MATDSLEDRITDQFSYRGERADVWRALDLVFETDAYLNLGYSPWYLPHVVGSSQRRLVTRVGDELAARLDTTAGVRLLDLGCGRGGPAVHLAERYGFDVTGVDLVPYNVARATEHARERGASASFVVGDAARPPLAPASVAACTAIDALVYLPDRPAVVAAIADVLEPGGLFVASDLFVRPDVDDRARRRGVDVRATRRGDGRARGRVDAFADAWDMPTPGTVAAYERGLEDAGIRVLATVDVSANSVGRFRTWTALYLRVVGGPLGGLVDRALERHGLDPATVTGQVRRAHEALPFLRHAIVVGRNRQTENR